MKPNEAWVKWKDENETARDPVTLGSTSRQREYLENRLHAAFMSGFISGQRHEKERIAEKLARLTE